jgi:ribosomal protein S27E
MEEELRCPKCNSSQTRYRVKTDDRICYVCGNVFKIEKKEEVKE